MCFDSNPVGQSAHKIYTVSKHASPWVPVTNKNLTYKSSRLPRLRVAIKLNLYLLYDLH